MEGRNTRRFKATSGKGGRLVGSMRMAVDSVPVGVRYFRSKVFFTRLEEWSEDRVCIVEIVVYDIDQEG
jgi:hypothetical protein